MEDRGLTLYEIAENYKMLDAIIEKDESGEDLTAYLDSIDGQLKDKVDSIVAVIRSAELSAEAIDSEIARLEGLKKTHENTAKRLLNYLDFTMSRHSIDTVGTNRVKLSYRTSRSVEIEDPLKLPTRFVVVKETSAPDKKAIKLAIDSGEEVPGARIKETRKLHIK